MRLSAPSTPQLADQDAEVVRREHEKKLIELQNQPLVHGKPIENVKLLDGVATAIPHGFGRPVLHFHSAVRGALANGRIDDVRDGTVDRTKYIHLKATGYGATIYIDLLVV
jgi:hypothetical protein